MNWNLAIEKNREALKRILIMLVAMVEFAGTERSSTLPRHLHRFVLRLLRPAEAATRRLIIIAARGLAPEFPLIRSRKPKPKTQPRTVLVLDRVDGRMVSVPMLLPEPMCAPSHRSQRPPSLTISLLDPMRRFGVRRRYVAPSAMPRIRAVGDPYFPSRPPLPDRRLPSPDDHIDAGPLHRRIDAIGRALDDLPGQARRLARWQARLNARLALEGSRDKSAGETGEGVQNGRHGGRRFQRSSPMRIGRPPGWRRKPTHEVDEVLNELHGLAVWARERPDTS